MLAENLQQVNANIEKACAAVSRDPGEVTLVAVSKTKPVSMLQEAYDAGARVFGENTNYRELKPFFAIQF